jgi:hypothetical protein
MRKSIKVAPGVRLNVSKRGVGASAGGRGGRYSVHSSGRRTVSAGGGVVPGVYYQKSVSGSGSRESAGQAETPTAPVAAKKPGLFAPKGEKALYKAVKTQDVHPSDSIAVRRLDAPSEAQAWREADLHLRIWEAMHPEARVRQSAS